MNKINCNIGKEAECGMDQFKTVYQAAYNRIEPDTQLIDRIAEELEDKRIGRMHAVMTGVMRPAAAFCAIMLIMSLTALPAAAKTIPFVYSIIEQYAPSLADFVLPEEISDTSAGITMQVEAINVEEHDADILVSFSDAEGSGMDLIKGKVDLYDSHHLRSFGASYNVGGCSFLEYDETTDKAYFKIDVSSDGVYDKGKLKFNVHQLLTNLSEEKRWIDLTDVVKNPAMKSVTLNGRGGSGDREAIEKYMGGSTDGSPRPGAQVLDMQKADESMIEALTVTGIGYADGILRVQSCRGNLSEADRHMQPFIIDSGGNERHNDFSVGWQETVNGEILSFDEHWFLVEESELEQLQMYGIFWITDGSVKGDWEVTFRVEE